MLTKNDIKSLENEIKEYALRGLRVLILAYKKIGKESIENGELECVHPEEEEGLILQALVGISDPIRT